MEPPDHVAGASGATAPADVSIKEQPAESPPAVPPASHAEATATLEATATAEPPAMVPRLPISVASSHLSPLAGLLGSLLAGSGGGGGGAPALPVASPGGSALPVASPGGSALPVASPGGSALPVASPGGSALPVASPGGSALPPLPVMSLGAPSVGPPPASPGGGTPGAAVPLPVASPGGPGTGELPASSPGPVAVAGTSGGTGSDDSDLMLRRLMEYIREKGGQWKEAEWKVHRKLRTEGKSAGTYDVYYYNLAGKKFRSRSEVGKFLGLEKEEKKGTGIGKNAALAGEGGRPPPEQLPLKLPNGITVLRLGEVQTGGAFHTTTIIWPVGYVAQYNNPRGAVFRSEIFAGGQTGKMPEFRVSVVVDAEKDETEVVASARTPDMVWERVSQIHQAALEETLARLKPKRVWKPRGPSQTPAASAPPAVDPSAGGQDNPAEKPATGDNAAVTLAGPQVPTAAVNGDAAPTGGPSETPVDWAVGEAAEAGPASPPVATSGGGASGGASAGEAARKPPPSVKSSPAQKRNQTLLAGVSQRVIDALVNATGLAGCWGFELFGMAEVRTLTLLEGLEGVEKLCPKYQPVATRNTWADEELRLERELRKHHRRSQKVAKDAEKLERDIAALLDKKKGKPAVKRRREEGAAQDKLFAKRPKQGSGDTGGVHASADGAPSGKRSAGAGGDPSGGRRSRGRPPLAATPAVAIAKVSPGISAHLLPGFPARDGAEICRVMEGMIAKVEKKEQLRMQREGRKAQKVAEKVAQKQEKARERQAERVAGWAAAAAAAAAKPLPRHQQDDDRLAAEARPPPPPRAICPADMPLDLVPGILEVWEFVGRFLEVMELDSVPSLEDLALSFLDPKEGKRAADRVQAAMVTMIATELFGAALDVVSDDSPEVNRRDLASAFPPVKEGTWQEVARRLFYLGGIAAFVRLTDASGGIDIALGPLVGSSPYGVLGPGIVLQVLLAGVPPGDPRTTVAALPLGAAKAAPEALRARQSARAVSDALSRLEVAVKLEHPLHPSETGGKLDQPPSLLEASTTLEQPLEAAGKLEDMDVDPVTPSDKAGRDDATEKLEASGKLGSLEPGERDAVIVACQAMLQELASVAGSGAGGGAAARLTCLDGGPAAAVTRSARHLDLLTIAKQLDAGVHGQMGRDGVDAFVADVRAVCELFYAAARRTGSDFSAGLQEASVGDAVASVVRRLEELLALHKEPKPAEADATIDVKPPVANGGTADEDAAKHSHHRPLSKKPLAPWEGCRVCWTNADTNRILLCDTCDAEYHIYCLEPPLCEVPSGDWFCPHCCEDGAASEPDGLDSLRWSTASFSSDQLYQASLLFGSRDYSELSAGERVRAAQLLAGLAGSLNSARLLLDETSARRKELRKEAFDLRIRIKKEEKEREEKEKEERQKAAAAKAAAEAESAGAAAKPTAEPVAVEAEPPDDASTPEEPPAEEVVPKGGGKKTRSRKRAAAEDGSGGEEEAAPGQGKTRVRRGADAELVEKAGPRDTERLEEVEESLRWIMTRSSPLGYDRYWNRYWLLGSFSADQQGHLFVEQRPLAIPPRAECPAGVPGRPLVERPPPSMFLDPPGDSAIGSVAGGRASPARPGLAQIPEPAIPGVSRWGWYPLLSDFDALVHFLNPLGQREGNLQRSLQRVRSQLFPRRPLPPTQEKTASAPPSAPAPTPAMAPNGHPPAPPSIPIPTPAPPATGGATPDAKAVMGDAGGGPAGDVAVKGEAGGPAGGEFATPETPVDVSELQKTQRDVEALLDMLPPDGTDPLRGTEPRQQACRALVQGASTPQDLMAALVLVEGMVVTAHLRAWWRLWSFPTPDPSTAGTLAAVRLRAAALRSAIMRSLKRGKQAPSGLMVAMSKAAAKGESKAKPSSYPLRERRLPPGALAEGAPEPTAAPEWWALPGQDQGAGEGEEGGEEDSDEDDPKPKSKGRSRKTGKAEEVLSDEEVARRLQAELNHAPRRGRGGAEPRPPSGKAAAEVAPRKRSRVTRAMDREASAATESPPESTPASDVDVPADTRAAKRKAVPTAEAAQGNKKNRHEEPPAERGGKTKKAGMEEPARKSSGREPKPTPEPEKRKGREARVGGREGKRTPEAVREVVEVKEKNKDKGKEGRAASRALQEEGRGKKKNTLQEEARGKKKDTTPADRGTEGKEGKGTAGDTHVVQGRSFLRKRD